MGLLIPGSWVRAPHRAFAIFFFFFFFCECYKTQTLSLVDNYYVIYFFLLTEQQRLKEKMERKDKGGGAITDQIKSGLGDTLRNTLSIEQIAAIKAKRFAKKRGTIKADDDITGGSVGSLS